MLDICKINVKRKISVHIFNNKVKSQFIHVNYHYMLVNHQIKSSIVSKIIE